MERRDLAEFFRSNTHRLFGIQLTDHQVEQFMTYLEQLRLWNRSTNLTSITEAKDIVVKHFIDSLAGFMADTIKIGANVLDIGSGAGFPGIPMKIVRPDLSFSLLEPAQKKVSFLHFIIGVLKLPGVRVVPETLEGFGFGQGRGQRFDYVITRALKYDLVLRLADALLEQDGKIILYTSRSVESETGNAWSLTNEFSFELPMQGGKRVVSTLRAAA